MRSYEMTFWMSRIRCVGSCSNWTFALFLLGSSLFVTFGAHGDLRPFSQPEILAEPGVGPEIAFNEAGESVVVWEDGSSVRAQSFDSLGKARGKTAEIQGISVFSAVGPAVGMDRDGRYAVAWRYSTAILPPDPPPGQVFLQIFDATGEAVGEIIEPFPNEGQVPGRPRLAMAPDGSFWIAAQAREANGGVIFLRRYDAQGIPLMEVLRLGAPSQTLLPVPLLALSPDGDIAVMTSHCEGITCSNLSVRSQVFSPLGEPRGTELELSDEGFGYGLTWSPQRGFVAVWAVPASGMVSSPQQQSFGIQGRAFAAEVLGPVFSVKEETDGLGFLPEETDLWVDGRSKLAADPLGNLVVTWEEEFEPFSSSGVYGRAIDSSFGTSGPILEISTEPGARAFLPAVAPLGASRFTVAWSLFLPEESALRILGQRFLVTSADCFPASTAFCLQQATPPGFFVRLGSHFLE